MKIKYLNVYSENINGYYLFNKSTACKLKKLTYLIVNDILDPNIVFPTVRIYYNNRGNKPHIRYLVKCFLKAGVMYLHLRLHRSQDVAYSTHHKHLEGAPGSVS